MLNRQENLNTLSKEREDIKTALLFNTALFYGPEGEGREGMMGAQGGRERLAPPPAAPYRPLPPAMPRQPPQRPWTDTRWDPAHIPTACPQLPNQPALPATPLTNDSAPRRAAPLGACLEAGGLLIGGDISQSARKNDGWAGGLARCAPMGEAERREAGVGLARGR